MSMERVKKGRKYYYIDDRMFILECIETGSPIDDARYKVGNYFHSPHKLSDMSFKLEKVLKGADVIEMPSEEEINHQSELYTYPPLFKAAINWLESKIVK